MQAYLLDDFKVEIDPRTAEIGGCWQGKPRDGIPTVWGMDELRFFYERTLECEQPVILDIGANTGAFSILAAMNPEMRSYAFEPASNTYEILNRNISLNRLANCVKTFQIALSDKNGKVVLKYPKSGKDSGLACIGEPLRFDEWIEFKVETRRLDDFTTEHGIEKVDLIKIDTEGCELLVLRGAQELIRRCHPGIFCEYWELNTKQFGYHPSEIVKFLTSLGYSYTKVGYEDMYFYHSERVSVTKPRIITSSSCAFELPGKLPHNQSVTSPSGFEVFDCQAAIEINKARQGHLASLGLELAQQSVLEVGSGFGLHTSFFEELGCKVLSTDARPENVAEHLRRYPYRKVEVADLSVPDSHKRFGEFDIIYCYGTLYHLSNPSLCIKELSSVCRKFFLIETCVSPVDNGEINPKNENRRNPNQSIEGIGCRPSRDWVMAELKKYFPFVYVTTTQPDHHEFPLNWPAPVKGKVNTRSVFVASRQSLNLPTLSTELPKTQKRLGAVPVSKIQQNNQEKFLDKTIKQRATGKYTNRELSREWIDTLALTQNRLYYRDQTPESLIALVELVHSYKPTKIVELGTLSGLSLRAWLAAKSKAEVIAIDLSFKPLFKSQEVLPVDLSGVRLLEQDILETDFSRLWSQEDKVLLYIDAHDQPNTSIMTHILENALPLLPQGSIVTVDDLWYSPETLTNDSVSKFFEEVTINAIDPLQCFEGYYAPYWKGGFFVGFREVVPLLEWVNCNNIELILNPDDKTVTFERPVLRKSTGESSDIDTSKRLTGSIGYNPVETVSVYGDRNVPGNKMAVALCEQGARFYACGRIKEAINCFKQAILLKSDINGAFYAQAVCFAREGNFEKAAESLRMEIKNEFCHPRAQRLYKDIQQYIRRKHKPISKVQETGPTGNITIFALPKAFTDTFATIQENALKSWMQLRPCPEIILFGNDEGVAEFAQKYNLKHIPNVQRNEFGTPLLNDLFLRAQTAATNEICVYINADIILMNDFVEALDKVGTEFDQFLMIGRRWDIDITEPVEFDKEKWQEHLRMQVKMLGSLHLDRGIDYFAFRKGLWRQIPPFGIGRTAWDNWLVYAPLSEGKDVVDATEAVTVVHQNHNFSHIRGGKETPRFQLEAQQNREIAGPVVLMGVGAASDATWRLTKDGLVRNKPEGYNTHLKELCSKLLEKGWDKKYNLYKKYFHSAQYLKQIKKPCISIVVISWRFHPDTVKNFEALAQQRDDNFELIFVNNGATNDEFEDLMPFIETYIKLNHNTGAYLARNIGALFAKAPILLFLDDDGIAETDIVRAYLRNFEKYDVIAVRGAVWPKERGAGPYSAHRYYGSKPFPYFSCQEGNTAYKASVFYQVSGWDDEIRWGHGGIDLSRRLMEIEPDMRKQMYSPEPVIHHDPVKDKKILEEKARKQKISATRLERKHPDFYVFQRRFNEYLQREDLLIHKDAYRGSYADMKGPDEHIYPFRDIVRHNPALQRAQPDTKKLTTSIKSGKELSATTDVNNQILAEESFRKGFRYLCKGDASEAIKYLEKAADNYTILPNLYFALATAYVQLGYFFSAKKACEIELSLQPDNSGARRLLERIEKQINETVSICDPNRCMVNGTTTEKYLNLKHNSNIFNFRKAIEKHCLPGTKQTGEKVLLQSAEKSNERLKMQVIGTEYGGWAVDLDLIPFGSTVVSAGVGEDISFDLGLINLKNCRVIGIDPTEKARRYIENNKNEHFDFLQKALYSESNKKIRIYKNTNPNYVSESITPSHKSVSEANFYEAETISIEDILNKYKNVSVLKMDIEGAEYEVLNSISKLDIPQICIEFHHFCTDFTADDTEKCIKHLQRMGYVLAQRTDECGTVKEATFVHQKYVSKKTAEMNIGEPETYVTKDIPVILVCYNRPKHTLEVLKALREHNIKNIYIFSDAPKSHEDEEAVSLTRHLVHSIDWTKPKIIERTENLGLARNIVSAVDYVFEKYDRLILLEDDCVPQRYFFDFMHTCLEKYENNQRVFGISGYTVQIPDKIRSDYPFDLYFCPRIGSWGWATWKRAWAHHEKDLYKLIRIANEKNIDLSRAGSDIPTFIESFLKGQLKDVWTLNWVLSVYINNGVYIYPTRTHISNIGTDGTGAHCGKTDKYHSFSCDTRPTRYPADVFLDEQVMENFKSYYRVPPDRSRSAVHFLRSRGQKRSLKIAQISTVDRKGGAAKVAWMLKEGLKARGLGTQMFVGQKLSNDPDIKIITDPIQDSNTYYKEQGFLSYDINSTFTLSSQKELLESDVAHFHNLHGNYFNPFALSVLTKSKPSVWTLHDMQSMTGHCAYAFDCEKWQAGCGNCPDLESYPPITKDRTAEMWRDKKIIYKESDFELIVPSQWLKNIVKKSILKDKKVHLIYNGINERIYRPLDKQAIRKMFKIPPNAIIISFVAHGGLIDKRKGGNFILEAYKHFTAKYPNTFFICVGGTSDKAPTERFLQIPFLFDEEKLVQLYYAADIFLFPTLADNCPLVILEVMGCGVPIVSFNTGGIPELIDHGQTGLIAGFKNSEEFIKMTEYLVVNRRKREEFGAAGRERLLKTFTLDQMVDKHITLYERLAEQGKKENYVLPKNKVSLPAAICDNKHKYLVSVIVSTYNSEKFIHGCLEELENQTIADKLEIIVVNSGSQENEEAIVHEYQQKYNNIVYIKTEQREGIYTAWNRAIKIARGTFLTNANTDDRHREDALEIMAETLLANPDVALVYGDQICTDTPNGTFANHHAIEMARRAEYSHERLLFGCCVGSQPMWRKSLHTELGYFDDTLTCAGDWDFWLRISISSRYKFKHIPEFLGLYYYNKNGIEHGRKIHSLYERYAVGQRYGSQYISTIPLYAASGNPLVSIWMAVYNGADYIARAIESVLIQNYRNFELIVVDDGSTDRTAEIVHSFKNEPIKYFFKENGGAASARNFAFKKSNGSFIVILDSDDMITPDFIARHLQVLEQYPESDLVYCDDCIIDEMDKPIRVMSKPEYSERNALISALFRYGWAILPFRTCIRKSVFDKIGLYDEHLIMSEDYDMVRRFVSAGLVMRHLPAALYLRHLTADSLSRSFDIAKARGHFEIVRKFTETFTAEQLFPDVRWDKLPAEQKLLLAKCKTALVYLGIGEQYVASNAPDFTEVAFELACSELNDCVKIDPENQVLRQLLQKSKLIRARYTEIPQQVVSK